MPEPITVLELLKRTTDFFAKKGVPTPKLDAEWLVAHGLGCKRLELFLRFEKIVEPSALEKLRELVRRRGEREPLQYILGEVPWCDLRLKVDKRCLVPRAETEELWEKIVARAQESGKTPERILDLGTGSGALALALKKSFPLAKVLALERSEQTLALAKENAALNALEVDFIRSDWFAEVAPTATFDLIVSNPPYLTEMEFASAEPEVRVWEPKEALTAPYDGLADLLLIIEAAKPHLATNGELWLEHGIAHAGALAAHAQKLAYSHCSHYKDVHGRDRFTRLIL